MEGAPEHNRTHASHGAGTPKSDQTLQMVVHPTRRIKPRPQIDRCHELHAAPHGPRCDIRFLVRGLRSAPSLGGWPPRWVGGEPEFGRHLCMHPVVA